MTTIVGFSLAPEGDKKFLDRLTFEREANGAISIGVTKPNGDWYAWATITEEELTATLQILGVLDTRCEEVVEQDAPGFPLGAEVAYKGTSILGTVLSTPRLTQRIGLKDGSTQTIPVDSLVLANKDRSSDSTPT